MKNFLRGFSAAFIIILALFIFCSCSPSYSDYTSFAMGSIINIRLYDSKENCDNLNSGIVSAVNDADSCLSNTKQDSDISKINSAPGTPVKVSGYTLKVLGDAVALCNICNLRADVTMGAVTKLWGFNTDEPRLPGDGEIAEALKTVGQSAVLIDEAESRVTTGENQQLDLGAFGKGAAADSIQKVLSTSSVPAVVSVGGTILLYGQNPDSQAWSVGIRNPFASQNEYFATLSVEVSNTKNAMFISTSGSYEKTFTENNVTYHHILSCETGYPADTGLVSVTVVSAGGLTSDGLSTVCFINGLNSETLTFLNTYSAQAVFVFKDGSYYVTDGLKDSFKLISGAEATFSETSFNGE